LWATDFLEQRQSRAYFLGYGHDDYAALALHLKRDLESECHLSIE
jgi:hypothetical protein